MKPIQVGLLGIGTVGSGTFAVLQRNFAPGARMGVQLKDLRNAQTTAAEVGLEVPITDFFAQLYTSAVEHGFDQLDHSGLFAELARRNGLQ